MADAPKILAQSNPAAATLTDIYTVPAVTSTVISTIIATNRSGDSTSFRISLAIAGAATSDEQFIVFDLPIAGNDVYMATIGATLETTDVVRVLATLATLSFTVLGIEITA